MYFLAIIQNASTAALYPYNDLDAALVAFHTELAYRNEARTSTVCVILNEFGVVVKSDSWFPQTEEVAEENE